jgi:hypothetical protein
MKERIDMDHGRSAAEAASGCEATPSTASRSRGVASLTLAISPETLDARAAGEVLLSYLNYKDRWGYSTREFLRGNFYPIEGIAPLDVRTCCCGCWANSPGEGDAIDWWRSDELGLDVFLHWDGDGTVVFKTADWILENGDCKNDHDWEWVTDRHWSRDLPPNYYEDEADAIAIEARRAETTGSVEDEGAVAQPIAQGD